jgi:glycine cleavage system H protein
MSNVKPELKYTKDHEWVKLDGEVATIGITDFAQGSLGDLVYVELPEAGRQVKAGEACAVVESCKAASDVYAPLSGKIVEANPELASAPEKINSGPYESWLFKIKISNQSELASLLSSENYQQLAA